MNRNWLTSGILVLALAVQAQAQSLVFSNDTAGVFSSVNFNAVTVAGNRFVAVGTNSTVWTFALSDTAANNGWINDGDNWTKAATSQFPNSALNFEALTTGGARFVTGGTSNLVFTSFDGVTWNGIGRAFGNTLQIKALAESDTGNYVAAAIGLDITFTNGLGPAQSKGWPVATINNPVPFEGYFGLASFGTSGLIVCGFGGVIRTSTDSGVHWSVSGTNSYLFSNTNLLAVGTDGTNFVVVGGGGTIKYCANGAGGSTNWTTAHVGVNNLNAIAWTGGEYIVAGDGGTILTSPDGVNWTPAQSPTTANLQGITFATSGTFQNIAMLVGAGGEVVIGGIPPTAAVVNGSASICNGSSVPVAVNLGGSAGPWNVTLSDGFDSYTTNTGSSTVTFTVTPNNSLPNSASNFTYQVTALTDDITGISAQAGGSLTGSFVVTDNPHPTSSLAALDTTNCNVGTIYTLTNTLTGLGPWTVVWSSNGIILPPQTVGPSGPGPFPYLFPVIPTNTFANQPFTNIYYVVSVSNNDTCLGNQPGDLLGTNIVVINPRPTAVVSGNATICNGSTTTISAALTGIGPWTVMWSDGAVSNNVAVSPATHPVSPADPNPNAPVTNNYTVVGLTDSHCTAQAGDITGGAAITVNPRPTVVVSGNATICNGSTTIISAALTGIGPWTVMWSDGAVSNNVAVSPATHPVSPADPNPNAPVTNKYTVVNLTDAHCTAETGDMTGSATIIVDPRPTAAVTGNATICNGSTTTISAALTGIGPWNVMWSDGAVSNNVAVSPATHPVSPANPNPNTPVTNNYTVVNLTDAHCTAEAGDLTGTAAITVNPRPTAVVTGSATICNGSTNILSAALTGIGPWNVTWSDGAVSNNVAVSPATHPVSPATPNPNTPITTNYTVVSLTDSHCTADIGDITGTATVTVSPRPTSQLTALATTNCNVGGSDTLTNILTGFGPWTVVLSSNGVLVTNIVGSAAPGPFTNTYVVFPTNALLSGAFTNIYFVLSVSNNDTCTGNQPGDITGTNTVVINPLPPAPTFVANQTNCLQVTPTPTLTVVPPAPGPLNGTSVAVNWYDANTNFLSQTSGSYIPSSPVLGTNIFFAQSVVEPTGCVSTNMTQVLLIVQDCLSGTSGWPKIQLVGTNAVVTWLGNVDLQGTNALTAVTNGWTNIAVGVAGATNTYTNTSAGSNGFFRLFAP